MPDDLERLYRDLERHEEQDEQRHSAVVLMIEDLKAKQATADREITNKHHENKAEFKDIKILLAFLIIATAPQLVSFVASVMRGKH